MTASLVLSKIFVIKISPSLDIPIIYYIVLYIEQVEAENHCTSQMRLLIDQISVQQGEIVALQGMLDFSTNSILLQSLLIGLTLGTVIS